MLSIIPARNLVPFSGTVVLMLLILAFNAGRVTATPAFPSETSADAGLARDMQVHHAQAVEMSMLVLDRTSDPDIRSMAYDMTSPSSRTARCSPGFESEACRKPHSRNPWHDCTTPATASTGTRRQRRQTPGPCRAWHLRLTWTGSAPPSGRMPTRSS